MNNNNKTWEQLRAINHQLMATEKQLRAANKQLRISEIDLKKEKQFSENLLNTANAFILNLDTNANIILFNKFAEKLTGYKKEEVLGRNWFDIFILKRDDSVIHDVFSSALKQMLEFSSYENPILCKSGSERLISWENTVLKDDNKKISGMLSIGTDITESKNTLLKLKEKKHFIESIINLSPDILYIYDIVEHKNVYSNDGIKYILGYSTAEILEMGDRLISTLMHPDDFKIYIKTIYPKYSQVKDHELILNQYRMKHKNGKWHWLDCSEVIFNRQPDSSPKQIFGVIHDITERKKAELALNQSQDLMQYVIEHSNSAVAVHDRDMNYIYVSKDYLTQYRVKEKDIIGKHHYDIFPDLPQKWREVHQRVLAGEVLKADDDPYEREDGSVDWTRWECRPWYEGDGSIGGLIVYTEVITERKQAEENLEKRNEELEIFNRMAVGRELKMIELKKEINSLLKEAGKEPAYEIVE